MRLTQNSALHGGAVGPRRGVVLTNGRGPKYEALVEIDRIARAVHLTSVRELIYADLSQARCDRCIPLSKIREIRWTDEMVF